jgi:hypothetical protein
MPGRLEVWVTERLDVCVGTNQVGKAPVIGSDTVSELPSVAGSVIDCVLSSLGSTKKPSGAAPLFVIQTGTVTGTPARRVVLALSGSPGALALTWLNAMFPV